MSGFDHQFMPGGVGETRFSGRLHALEEATMYSHTHTFDVVRRSGFPVALFMTLLALLVSPSPANAGGTLTITQGTYRLGQDEVYDTVTISSGATLQTHGHTLTIDAGGTLTCSGTLAVGYGGSVVAEGGSTLTCTGLISIDERGVLDLDVATLTLTGEIAIEDDGTTILRGGVHTATNGCIVLSGPDSLLHITENTTLGSCGTGCISGEHPEATIQIDQGVTLTSQLTIEGTLTIAGPGTLKNKCDVIATSRAAGDTILLATNLNLSDIADANWTAEGGTLEFKHQQTSGTGGGLLGNVWSVQGGTLHFFQSVTFDDGVACSLGGTLFIWNGPIGLPSYLIIEPGKTFKYRCFTSDTCSNPGLGIPYAVTAGSSQLMLRCVTPSS